MAALAIVGSHAINGVARIHSELIKRDLFKVKSSEWSSCPKSWLSNLIWIKRGFWDFFAGVPWHLAREVPEQDQRHHPTKVLFRNKVIVIAQSSFHFVLGGFYSSTRVSPRLSVIESATSGPTACSSWKTSNNLLTTDNSRQKFSGWVTADIVAKSLIGDLNL